MFNYAAKRRHLAPYAENPFRILEIDRIPVEQMRPIALFTAEQERAFLEACDDWQFPLFLTLMLTGFGPENFATCFFPTILTWIPACFEFATSRDLAGKSRRRNEREIPLVPVLAAVLRAHLDDRWHGPSFDVGRRRPTAIFP